MIWNKESDDALKVRLRAGLSSSEIAKDLFTTSAAIRSRKRKLTHTERAVVQVHFGCRYVLGEPQDRQFCGEPITQNSYCGVHAAMCYLPTRKINA